MSDDFQIETPLSEDAKPETALNPMETGDLVGDNHQEPTDYIAELALEIFHNTQELHGLALESQEILRQAARLRASTLPPPKKKPFLGALELVRSQVSLDLKEQDQRVLAGVLACLQGRLKAKDFNLLEFTSSQRGEILTIAAILEIAQGLDHSGTHSTTIVKVEPCEDGLWMIVAGPSAELDAAEGKKAAQLWSRIGYPDLEVLLPDQAVIRSMPFPLPQERIGIRPDDPLSEAGRKVMCYHFAEMLRHEDGTRLGEDIEALHDMRVATRRLRAAFEVFGSAFDKRALKPHLTGLRMTGRTLGAVRDMDVFMEKAQRYLQTLPESRQTGLNPLLDHWREQRAAARAEMISYLDSRAYAQFKRDFNIFLNTPFAGVSQIQADQPEPVLVRQIAPVLIYTRMASVRAFETHLEHAPIELLHLLRIEFKKLRYTVEYFREVLGKHAFEVIEDLKILQDHLGDLNDAQVATQILGEFIVSWEKNVQPTQIFERQSIEEVVSYLAARHAERHHLLTSFGETWSAHFDLKAFRRRLAQAVAVL